MDDTLTAASAIATVYPEGQFGAYRNWDFTLTGDVFANSPTMELNTRDLPENITAYEVSQILNLVIRVPKCVVERDFAPVARFFKAVAP